MRAMHLPVDPAQAGAPPSSGAGSFVDPGSIGARVLGLDIGAGQPWAECAPGVRESSSVDLREWIVADHASTATRFERGVRAHIPVERWRETGGTGGSSVAWLLFHVRYHEDLAVSTVIRGRPPRL